MWLLGCPGDARYSWANGTHAQEIYIGSVVGIGTVSCMLSSVAAVETRCKSFHENPDFYMSYRLPHAFGILGFILLTE